MGVFNFMEEKEMFKVTTSDSKQVAVKKNIQLKNISVKDLRIVDTDTGEDISEQVIAEIPDGVSIVDFKLTFEIDEPIE